VNLCRCFARPVTFHELLHTDSPGKHFESLIFKRVPNDLRQKLGTIPIAKRALSLSAGSAPAAGLLMTFDKWAVWSRTTPSRPSLHQIEPNPLPRASSTSDGGHAGPPSRPPPSPHRAAAAAVRNPTLPRVLLFSSSERRRQWRR
jgi:hypothetical protein